MFPGAGEAVSRRRGAPFVAMLVSFTVVLLYRFFTGSPVRFSLPFGGRRSHRTTRRRQVMRFLGVVFLVTLSLRVVSASPMCREGSLTTALFRFTATLPVEPTFDCHRSSHDVDATQAVQPPMELNYQPKNSLFSSMGRSEPNILLLFAPLQAYDTRSTSFTRVDLIFIGNSSFSPPLKVKLYSPACILSNYCTVHLRRNLSGVLSSDTVVQSKSRSGGASPSRSTAKGKLSFQFDWAWPICVSKSGSPSFIFPEPRSIEVMIKSLLIFDGWVVLSEISDFSRCILPYFSKGMILQRSLRGLKMQSRLLWFFS
ncbi:hypothetical protein N665_0471s0014 [Sinapis alba]|nr:hypothetical protein N665_0471s0014 [Sinapis alba]